MPAERMPAGFARDAAGRLLVAGQPAEQWVAEAGDTPLFVYNGAQMRARVSAFRAAMPPGVRLHYAVKANPMPALLFHMAGLVDGFDVASAGELDRAMAAGMDAGAISFAGPGKRDRELLAAIRAGVTLNVESGGELARAGEIARAEGMPARVAIRINPPFELKGSGMRMGGGARPFGVDADAVPAMLRSMHGRPEWQFQGFHIFAGSQNLDPDALAQAQRLSIALVAELSADAPCPPALVNLGGGFGVPYFPADRALDVGAVGAALGSLLRERPAILAESRFAIELGRWLMAEAGVYLCRVVDRKRSGGEVFLVTDGGLHHQLAASGNFGTVIRRNYPLVNASRAEPVEVAHVVGCLCTPLDRLGDAVSLGAGQVGDLIAIFMAGAYGRSASPEAFLGHPPAGEILVYPASL